jgi:transcriptional regulator with XRE-family HTH domain
LDDIKPLVDEVNRIRLEEDLSYAALATAIGIDPGALYKILNGRSDPWDRTLFKIRRYLGQRGVTPVTRKVRRKASAA